MKPDRDGMDWRVTANYVTRLYIAAQRANDEPEYQDRLPEFYASESAAVYRAQQLAQTYAPAQVVHHFRPTTVPVSAIPREDK